MTDRSATSSRPAWLTTTRIVWFAAAASAIIGALGLLFPTAIPTVIAIGTGVFLIVEAFLRMSFVFGRGAATGAMRWVFLVVSLALATLGILALVNPWRDNATLLLVVGIGWLVDAVAWILSAIASGKREGMAASIVVGLLLAVIGGFLIAASIALLQQVLFWVCIVLLIGGIASLVVLFVLARQAAKPKAPPAPATPPKA